MSKAFKANEAQEGDADSDCAASSGAPALPAYPAGTPNYITRSGYLRLQAELNKLLRFERPEVVKVVSWAAGNGDRSENGDYIYGKKRLREIDRRIRFLSKRIEQAEVVDPERQEQIERVFFGATVTVLEDSGAEFTCSIVGVDEADPSRARYSWISPLARALLKAELGDSVRFHTPGGWRELEIVKIEYTALD